MKIVNRKEFLQLPEHTLYSLYQPCGIVDGLHVKHGTLTNDWIYTDLLGDIEAGKEAEFHEVFDEAEKGKVFTLDYECGRRDGCFEEEQLFMVYGKSDVGRLIEKLRSL
jgi:hypothetical protein